ncbi:MAG: nuclear transport factor 2 family protein [Chloroflexi bacterium]|nr:nuclear transport factor 2 family protein [Chloroflexota bacterium]
MELVNKLHVDDFELINPGAQVSSKQQYLGAVASGELTYRVWEPDTQIAVRFYGHSAIIRYRSRAVVIIQGEQVPFRGAWHTDLYEKRGDQWQVVWSHATGIQ